MCAVRAGSGGALLLLSEGPGPRLRVLKVPCVAREVWVGGGREVSQLARVQSPPPPRGWPKPHLLPYSAGAVGAEAWRDSTSKGGHGHLPVPPPQPLPHTTEPPTPAGGAVFCGIFKVFVSIKSPVADFFWEIRPFPAHVACARSAAACSF